MCWKEDTEECVGRKMLRMELPGKRKRGRPSRRFIDVFRESIKAVDVKRKRQRTGQLIYCGDP